MTDRLWTAYEAAAATDGMLCVRGGHDAENPDLWVAEEWSAQGISIDTRSIKPGEIFVALKDARDGHEFLSSAFERGASAALVDRAPKDTPDGAPLLVVRDTLDGLRDLARAARVRNFGKRIAVTGSAGKTSTKEMMRTALAANGTVHAADKSFNNHLGVPLTLASMPMHSDFGVFEIGMNHAGEITPLTALVAPHVAVITTVAPAHLEFFPSVEAIAEAKAEIFSGLVRGGAAILPRDNEHFDLLSARADRAGVSRKITFGAHEESDYRLISHKQDDKVATIEAQIFGQDLSYQLGVLGRHQAMNSLAVLAAAAAVGADVNLVAKALNHHQAGTGRGERKTVTLNGAAITIIDESYNANPVSMAASIASLGATEPQKDGRRIAVLGDMLELGDNAKAFHADLAKNLTAEKVDLVFTAGTMMNHLFSSLPQEMRGGSGAEVSEIAPLLLNDLRDGDIILVKGSNASKVSEIISILENGRRTG